MYHIVHISCVQYRAWKRVGAARTGLLHGQRPHSRPDAAHARVHDPPIAASQQLTDGHRGLLAQAPVERVAAARRQEQHPCGADRAAHVPKTLVFARCTEHIQQRKALRVNACAGARPRAHAESASRPLEELESERGRRRDHEQDRTEVSRLGNLPDPPSSHGDRIHGPRASDTS